MSNEKNNLNMADLAEVLNEEDRAGLVDALKKDKVKDKLIEKSAAEESEPLGPFCSWSGRTVEQALPETCGKSNSTGFPKFRRFRDLVLRSNRGGRDAFVFLNGDKNNQSSSSSLRRNRRRNHFFFLLVKFLYFHICLYICMLQKYITSKRLSYRNKHNYYMCY